MTTDTANTDATERSPCATCGTPVDIVRAPQVAVIDERYRFYCSRECRERGRTPAARSRSARVSLIPRPSVVEVADMLALPRESLPQVALRATRARGITASRPVFRLRPRDEPADPLPPALAVSIAAFAVLVASLGVIPVTARAVVLGLCAFAAVGVAAREVWRFRGDTDMIGWIVGLAGALVPMIAALREGGHDVPTSLRDAAVFAAVGPLVAWANRTRRASGQGRMENLRNALAQSARIPRRDALPDASGTAETAETVEASRLKAGAEVIVGTGAVVPVDGVVRAGEASVIPWPSAPETQTRRAGDAVLAGARVTSGEIRVMATRAGEEVAWARLSRMLKDEAQAPQIVLLARRLGELVPGTVVAAAVLAAVARALLSGGDAVHAAACVLALAPCALVDRVAELPFIDALVAAARKGIVFRDAASVESAARVGTVVLCLRGTVTVDQLELTEVVSLGDRSESELIATAAAAEEVAQGDPIARSLTEAATKRAVRLEGVRRPALVQGQGVTALNVSGEPVVIGNRRLLLTEGVSVAPAEDVAAAIEGAGRTAVFVAIGGKVEGVLGFEDRVRSEARSSVQAMMDAGFDVALLGGSSRATMESIGAMLDVANLRPEVLPEERAAVVRTLSDVGNGVAVVGRPARDGAALASADVAISIEAAGGAGAETAMALASDDLRDAAAALGLARKARESAVAVMLLGVGVTALGAVVVALVPSWAVPFVLGTFVAVMAGQSFILRERESE